MNLRRAMLTTAITLIPALAAATPLDIEMQAFCDTAFHQINGLKKDVDIRYIRVAVVPFRITPSDGSARRTERVLTDYLTVACLDERYDLRASPAEPALIRAMHGGDTAAARTLASGSGTQAVISAEITRSGDLYRIAMHVLPTWDVDPPLPSYSAIDAEPLDRYAQTLLEGQSRWGAVWRSAVVPGLGQFYNGDHLEGAIFVGLQAALIGGAIALEVQGRRHLESYRLGTPSTLDAHGAAMDAFERRTWLLGASGVVWAFGIARAWMAGADYDPRASFDTAIEVVPAPAGGLGLSLQGRW